MLLLLGIKYLMSLIWLLKLTITKTISETAEKITNHDHDKYFTIPLFNKLTEENFIARLAQANLASKNNIAAY